jgi:energy-coupling factor transport system substrate-specific component
MDMLSMTTDTLSMATGILGMFGGKKADTLGIAITIIISLLIALGFIYYIYKLVEKKNLSVEYIVLLAVLVAIGAVCRLIQPMFSQYAAGSISLFIIIMAGIVFGKETGFIVGVLTELVPIKGIGFWLVYTMIASGLIGFLAGVLSEKLNKDGSIGFIIRGIFAIVCALAYGVITSLSMVFFYGYPATYLLKALLVNPYLRIGILFILLILAYIPIRNALLRAKERYLGSTEEISQNEKNIVS